MAITLKLRIFNTVHNLLGAWAARTADWVTGKPKSRIDILYGLDGLVESGEMLLVLGNPGSGCTTMLKSLAGATYDFCVDRGSVLNYQGRYNSVREK